MAVSMYSPYPCALFPQTERLQIGYSSAPASMSTLVQPVFCSSVIPTLRVTRRQAAARTSPKPGPELVALEELRMYRDGPFPSPAAHGKQLGKGWWQGVVGFLEELQQLSGSAPASEKETSAHMVDYASATSVHFDQEAKRAAHHPRLLTPSASWKPLFGCNCFQCYQHYWGQWHDSTNSTMVDATVVKFGEHMNDSSRVASHAATSSFSRSALPCGESVSAGTENENVPRDTSSRRRVRKGAPLIATRATKDPNIIPSPLAAGMERPRALHTAVGPKEEAGDRLLMLAGAAMVPCEEESALGRTHYGDASNVADMSIVASAVRALIDQVDQWNPVKPSHSHRH